MRSKAAIEKVTITEVAREAGVSTQTVSRVVNDKTVVRPQTRQRVLDAIERLGYRPNSVARSLVTNKTLTIGLVVPDIGNPYFSEIVRGAEDAARTFGYHIFLCNTDQMPERELTAIRALQGRQVDGIVLCSTRLPEEDLREVFRSRQPIVLAGREWVEGAAGAVHSDDYRGIMLAVDHLLASGCNHLAFAAGWPGGPGHRRRKEAWEDAMIASELGDEHSTAVNCPTTPAGGYEAVTALLSERPDIDGIICFNDLVGIGAMRACLESGRRVPEDVAVVGMSDIALASLVQPPLTTVRHSKHDIGKRAVEMLVDHLAGREHERQVVLRSDLIVRASAPN